MIKLANERAYRQVERQLSKHSSKIWEPFGRVSERALRVTELSLANEETNFFVFSSCLGDDNGENVYSKVKVPSSPMEFKCVYASAKEVYMSVHPSVRFNQAFIWYHSRALYICIHQLKPSFDIIPRHRAPGRFMDNCRSIFRWVQSTGAAINIQPLRNISSGTSWKKKCVPYGTYITYATFFFQKVFFLQKVPVRISFNG